MAHLPPRPQSLDGERSETASGDSAAFARWVLAQAGLDPTAYLAAPLARRSRPCLRAVKARTEDEARAMLIARPELVPTAVGALLIGVTAFCRDSDVFETLRDRVLPALAARGGTIRVWSAGCADGGELYSVAVLLAEAGLFERAQLLGTDCRPEAVERARAARYPVPQIAAWPEPVRAKYFAPAHDGSWEPVEAVRRAVWKTADVLAAIEPGPWDLILWRNVAIYLETPARRAVMAGHGERVGPGRLPGGRQGRTAVAGPPPPGRWTQCVLQDRRHRCRLLKGRKGGRRRRRGAEELAAQSEELSRQNEELAEQSEELTSQSEELARQNEELAEQALREADRNKNEFLATLSHELRNPLAPIRYALDLLTRGEGYSAPAQVIERQLRHLTRLVDDLLDVTRIASNSARPPGACWWWTTTKMPPR